MVNLVHLVSRESLDYLVYQGNLEILVNLARKAFQVQPDLQVECTQ
jgi:hypothetical protein